MTLFIRLDGTPIGAHYQLKVMNAPNSFLFTKLTRYQFVLFAEGVSLLVTLVKSAVVEDFGFSNID